MSKKSKYYGFFYYGFFSPRARDLYGSNIWQAADGSEVEVTGISKTKDGSSYLWSDKVPVGKLRKLLRVASHGRVNLNRKG